MASKGEIEREQERNRGILNGPDRKWLLLDRDEFIEEHSRQYWGQRRDEIIDRVQNALLDFSLLYDHLDDELCYEIVFEEDYPGHRGSGAYVGPDGTIPNDRIAAIRDTLSFIIFGTVHESDTREAVENQTGYEWTTFGDLLEEAIKQVGIRHGVLIDEIDPMVFRGRRAPKIETTIKRAKKGKRLTGAEIELLRESGRLNEDELTQALQEAVDDR